MADRPIACVLTAAQLGERRHAWADLNARWGLLRALRPEAVVLTYARNPEAMASLENLVDLERECCAWIDFELLTGDETVDLVMRATPQGLPIVAAMFEVPSPA